MNELDLSEIRRSIDDIDKQLLCLFTERMECSAKVAEYKTAHNLPVLNARREQEILDEIGKAAGGNATAAKMLFSTIMNISRCSQYPSVTKNSPLRDELKAAENSNFSPETAAFQGTDGSYSQAAAKRLYPDCELISFEHFEDVFKAVKSGQVDVGIVPEENSYAGVISENHDLLLRYDLKINGMTDLPVNHCLLIKNGGDISRIKTVYSHEQALAQCADYIDEMGFAPVAMENTAFAAKYVAEQSDYTSAAIAGEQTALLYGLQIAKHAVQSSGENYTRFIAVAKNMSIADNADTISIAFSIPHTPGSLFKVLSMLSANGLNMTRIQSRPDKASPFRYVFYVDFTGSLKDDKVVSLLCGLKDELPMLKIFGNCKII